MKRFFLVFFKALFCSLTCNVALVEYTDLSQLSGKFGGKTGAKNNGGDYWRRNGNVGYSQSVAQLEIRAMLSVFSRMWREITEDQRKAWNQAALSFPYQNRIGQTKYLSGAAHFNKCNMNLYSIGVAPVSDPVVFADLLPIAELTGLTATHGANTLSLVFVSTPTDSSTAHLVYATRCMSQGRMSDKLEYKLIGVIDPLATSPAALGVGYTAIFGSLLVDTKIYLKLIPIDATNGIAGLPLKISTIVA